MTDKNKFEDALAILQNVNKDIKVTKLTDPETLANVETWIPTRNLALDAIMGGGAPVRRVIEIYGKNSSGKTLLATEMVIAAQQMGMFCVYADIEIALGIKRMIKLGIDGDKLVYAPANTFGEVMTLLESSMQIKNEIYGQDHPMIFVFDSVAALVTEEELAANWEDKDYPRFAAKFSKAFRRIIAQIAENNVCLVLINQTRQNLGQLWGEGVVTYGGEAAKFYSSIRLEVDNWKGIFEEKDPEPDTKESDTDTRGKKPRRKVKKRKTHTGDIITVTTVKNRLHRPHIRIPVHVDYLTGVLPYESVFQLLLDYDIITQAGAWYTMHLPDTDPIKFQKKTFEDKYFDNFQGIKSVLESTFDVTLPDYMPEEEE